MKKIKKINLNLNKEVISSLSESDLNQVRGGVNTVPVCTTDGVKYCYAPATEPNCPESMTPCPWPETSVATCPIVSESLACEIEEVTKGTLKFAHCCKV